MLGHIYFNLMKQMQVMSYNVMLITSLYKMSQLLRQLLTASYNNKGGRCLLDGS